MRSTARLNQATHLFKTLNTHKNPCVCRRSNNTYSTRSRTHYDLLPGNQPFTLTSPVPVILLPAVVKVQASIVREAAPYQILVMDPSTPGQFCRQASISVINSLTETMRRIGLLFFRLSLLVFLMILRVPFRTKSQTSLTESEGSMRRISLFCLFFLE